MKSKIAALAVLILLLAGTGLFLTARADADAPVLYTAEDVYERAEPSVFYIRILRNDGTVKAVGTGVLLTREGLAVTAYHVVKDAERIEALLHDGSTAEAVQVTGFDEAKDVAVLKLPPAASAYGFLPVRETPVKHGETIYAIGYPLKNTPLITQGIVNTPKAEVNGRNRVLVSAQIASGMSGGPVIDQRGRLAGIISGSLRTVNGIHLVIDTEDLRSLLPADFRQEAAGGFPGKPG